MRIVGTNHGGYANERNISGLPFGRHRVVRCNNLHRLTNYIHFKLRDRIHPMWGHLHWDGGIANYDLLHLFNGISLGRKPWLSTFETYLPRWAVYGEGRVEWGLSKLAGKSCKRLIALSECAKEIQRQYLHEHPQYLEDIMSKVSVLHPSQAPLLSREEVIAKSNARSQRQGVHMVFVGAYFFLKGGLETLRATEVLLRKGHPLHLHIVSTMLYGDHASKTTKADLQEALKIIARHPKFIHHHDSLRNAAVLDLFRSADIGLLPTWADTYGYSALEAMAAGCPVISTDIRALPEFNDGTTGWPIQMPKDDWGYARIVTGEQRRAFSIQLQESLISIFEQILANPQEIHEKALSAYDRIVGRHSPEKAAAVLENWYDEAMDPGS